MLNNTKGRLLNVAEMKELTGGGATGCRYDYCTRTQGCCPGLVCALLPDPFSDIRGSCQSFDDFDS